MIATFTHDNQDRPGCPDAVTATLDQERRMTPGSTHIRMFLLAACALVLLPGCGQKAKATPMGTVSGTVTIKGKPLEIGRLNFASGQQGTGASGSLGPDGKYILDGPLATGTYDVFVSFEISPAQFGTPAADVLKTVPSKYQRQNTSKLVAQVEEGTNECKFELK